MYTLRNISTLWFVNLHHFWQHFPHLGALTDFRLMLGYYKANISRSPGRVIFIKGSANVLLTFFHFMPQLMVWTFAIIIYIPFESDWVQNTAIHWVCFVGVHTPLLFCLEQLQVTLASSSLQVSGQKLVVWHLKATNKYLPSYLLSHIKLIFCWQSYDILLTAIYFRYIK